MSSKLTTALRMPFKLLLFFCINVILCGIARAAIEACSLKRLSVCFGKFEKNRITSPFISEHQMQLARLIGQSVRLAAKYTPWNSTCLTQAMVATCWCRWYQIPYAFYIGVKAAADKDHGFAAHAWVLSGPIAITGGHGLLEYNVLSNYSSDRMKEHF